MPSFQVETVEMPQGLVVKIKGDAGVAAAGELQRQLGQLSSRPDGLVVLDLAELTFISSLGMGTLVEYHRKMARNGCQVRVAAAQPMVRQAFTRSMLDEVLDFHPSVDEALGT